MAKYDAELIVNEFRTGKFSQRDLAKRHGVSVGLVNKLTKGNDKAFNEVVNAQMTINTATLLLSESEMNAIVNVANELTFNTSLITNATQMNLVRMTQHLAKNQRMEKVGAGDGVQRFEPVELGSADYKNLQDAIDKAAITLKVADRHAPKVEVNNTNAQQNNVRYIGMRRMTDEEKQKARELNGRDSTS